MRDLKNKLTSGKNTKNIQPRKGKSFGYQVLGFGAGGSSDAFIVACGGTVTEDGNFKIHTFTGPGTFTVASLASDSANDVADYLVVAGGGSGGVRNPGNANGGGGAGGFRYSSATFTTPACAPANPIKSPTGLTLTASSFTIAVGGGGPAVTAQPSDVLGNDGAVSTFSSITSAGGGGGGAGGGPGTGRNGGSGGGSGGGGPRTGGTGNSPPVSPAQGTNGGNNPGTSPDGQAAGGGGATVVGSNATPSANGPGGAGAGIPTALGTSGVPNAPTDAFRYFAGGGGSGIRDCVAAAPGGIGGGGTGGSTPQAAQAGTANTGSGGGGGCSTSLPADPSGAGGSGIVVIRYRFQAD
mgnify:CR=1 FL=1